MQDALHVSFCLGRGLTRAHRWDPDSSAVHLDRVPHTRLTRPAKVFDFHFQGQRKALGRDTMVRLETIAQGTLNAVVYWFDLHLDEDCSLCSGMPLSSMRPA